MAVISYKCPNCGGDLRFDPKTQKFKCEYCISVFDKQELEAANPDTRVFEEDHGKTEAEKKAQGNPEERASSSGGAVVYTCPSCGAEIVTDETTAATFCYYCHNPVVLSGRLSGDYRPDLVVPFAVDKKEATESFLSYVTSKRFVPKDFFCKEQIEKISGVYFPFWIYSCGADGCWQGNASKLRVYRRGDIEFTETRVYEVERRAEFTFENLSRNALNRENRQLVEAVQPFRMEDARAFSMGYLSGFQAEKRNMEKSEFAPQLKDEISGHAAQMLRASVSGYSTVNEGTEQIHIGKDDWKYLLLPVWVLTYRGKNGKLYYYAMNGQTKKVSGILPVDKKRIMVLFFGIFFVLTVVLLLGGYFVW